MYSANISLPLEEPVKGKLTPGPKTGHYTPKSLNREPRSHRPALPKLLPMGCSGIIAGETWH